MFSLNAPPGRPLGGASFSPACIGLSALLHLLTFAVLLATGPASGRPPPDGAVDARKPLRLVWVTQAPPAPETASPESPAPKPATPTLPAPPVRDAPPERPDDSAGNPPPERPPGAEAARPAPGPDANAGPDARGGPDAGELAEEPTHSASRDAGPEKGPPPGPEGLSVRFVGIEDGQWLEWLRARGGLVGLSRNSRDRIESLYTAAGEPVRRSGWTPGRYWPLEIDHPGRISALRRILRRERYRLRESAGPRRVVALFPNSFQREVLAAIRESGAGDLGAFLVSFTPTTLQVVPAATAPDEDGRPDAPAGAAGPRKTPASAGAG